VARDITGRRHGAAELQLKVNELERSNRAITQDQQEFIALKTEINDLLVCSGRPPKYEVET
jgi:hypothetical protein